MPAKLRRKPCTDGKKGIGAPMLAALFVAEGGPYFGVPGIDPWPESRDARKYRGPHPVIAHPPCARWCQLAHIVQKRYGYKIGDDGGSFKSALAMVRKWGGVLEHPAFSLAWPAFGLPRPFPDGVWHKDLFDPGWVCQIPQLAFGHRARKLTWLYYVGENPPTAPRPHGPTAPRPHGPTARISDFRHRKPEAQVSFCGNHGNSELPRLRAKEASATPPLMREWLISLAKRAKRERR